MGASTIVRMTTKLLVAPFMLRQAQHERSGIAAHSTNGQALQHFPRTARHFGTFKVNVEVRAYRPTKDRMRYMRFQSLVFWQCGEWMNRS